MLPVSGVQISAWLNLIKACNLHCEGSGFTGPCTPGHLLWRERRTIPSRPSRKDACPTARKGNLAGDPPYTVHRHSRNKNHNE